MRVIFLVVVALVFASCKSSSQAESTTPASTSSENSDNSNRTPLNCFKLAKDSELIDTTDFSTTTILNYEVVEGCACIKYQYSGCLEGETVLSWNGEWNESNRPEVMMKLRVKGAGDCEQLITDSACYSMKEMQLVGNQVLVFLNRKDNNFLLNYNDKP